MNPTLISTALGMRLAGYAVWWIDTADYSHIASYLDARKYMETRHRFPNGLPNGAVLRYDDTCDGQPVIVIGGVTFGLEV